MSGAPESAWERAFEEWNRGLVPGGPHSIAHRAGWNDAVRACAEIVREALLTSSNRDDNAACLWIQARVLALDPASRPEGGRGAS